MCARPSCGPDIIHSVAVRSTNLGGGPAGDEPDGSVLRTIVGVPGTGVSLEFVGGRPEYSLFGQIAAERGRYETPVIRLLRRLLPPDAVVVDAGAHIGLISLIIARSLPGSDVRAIEAIPASADLLELNRIRNGISNVTVHRAALGAEVGSMRMHAGGDFSAGASFDADVGEVSVPVTTVDDWVAEHGLRRIDAIKIDVQGAEPLLLEGAARTLRDLRPMVTMEVNPAALRRVAGADTRQVWDTLNAHYPFIAWVGRGGALLELGSADQLLAALRRRGVGNIFCHPHRPARGGLRALLGHVLERLPDRGTEYAAGPELRLAPVVRPPRHMTPGTAILLPVLLTNHTGSRLRSSGRNPLRVAARWWDEDGRLVVDGRRSELGGTLRDEGCETVGVELEAPDPGNYTVRIAALHEHHAWLDDLGPAAALDLEVAVDDFHGIPGIS